MMKGSVGGRGGGEIVPPKSLSDMVSVYLGRCVFSSVEGQGELEVLLFMQLIVPAYECKGTAREGNI
jgi:hypothetical protein